MGQSKILEIILVGMWLLIAINFYFKYKPSQNEPVPLPHVLETPDISTNYKGKSFFVRRVNVNTGSSYDFTLKDEVVTRILGELSVAATKESRQKIIELLNHTDSPRIILRDRRSDGKWLVDFFVVENGNEINVADWLKKNKLVYQ